MASTSQSQPNLRPPTPSHSDQGDESCDEVDEGLYEEDDRDSDGEAEKGPAFEEELIEQFEEELKKEMDKKKQKGKGKAKEEEEEEMMIIEPQKEKGAASKSIRIDQFSTLLQKRTSQYFNKAEYKLAKKAGKAGLKLLHRSFKAVATTLSQPVEEVLKRIKRPLRVSDFPSLPPSSNLGQPPLHPTITYPKPLANLPANGLRDLVAAGGPGGGGGNGGEIELDASTQHTGSTETCPGGEDVQVEENAGVIVLDVQRLVEGMDVYDHYYSPFTPSTPHHPLLISQLDPSNRNLLTRQGLISSSTTELYKGHNETYRYQMSNYSLYILHPSLPKVVASRCPGGTRYFNIINSRQLTRRHGPGHHATNRTNYRLFAKNGRGLVLIETKWKVKTSGETSFHHYLWLDASVAEEESWRKRFLNEKFIEGEKRRGKRLPSGSMKKVDSWIVSLPPDVKAPVQALKDLSKNLNPFVITPPSLPVLNSESIHSSSSFTPSSSLIADIKISSARMPSKTVSYHQFHQPLVKEFWKDGFQLNSGIRGGTVLMNHDGENVQLESVFGVCEDLEKLGILFEEASGGLVKGKELGTVHVSLPRGAASEWRKVTHKTLPYQAVLIVQDYARNKPELWGKAVFFGILTWTSAGIVDIAISSILPVNPNFNQVFIIGGNDWLSARAAFSHDPFEGMGLVTSEKSSKRHEKKLMGEPVDNESESLKSVVTKWEPMLEGGFMEVKLTKESNFVFYPPFGASLRRRRNLPPNPIRIAFRTGTNPDGSLSLGARLFAQVPPPSKLRLYCTDETLSCSFDSSTQQHSLDQSTLTKGTVVLLDYVKWIVFDEIDEGRMPGLKTGISSDRIKEMVETTKRAYESSLGIGIGGSQLEVEKKLFEEIGHPYEEGLPVWLRVDQFVKFAKVDSSVTRTRINGLASKRRLALLGHGSKKAGEAVTETLYYLYKDESAETGGKVWVKGRTAEGDVKVQGYPYLWDEGTEKKVFKAVVRCEELHEEMLERGSKRRKVG